MDYSNFLGGEETRYGVFAGEGKVLIFTISLKFLI